MQNPISKSGKILATTDAIKNSFWQIKNVRESFSSEAELESLFNDSNQFKATSKLNQKNSYLVKPLNMFLTLKFVIRTNSNAVSVSSKEIKINFLIRGISYLI